MSQKNKQHNNRKTDKASIKFSLDKSSGAAAEQLKKENFEKRLKAEMMKISRKREG